MPRSHHSSCSVGRPVTCSASTSGSVTSKAEVRSRPRFPRTALRLLEEWLSKHRESPYPTLKDLDLLTASTGLKRSQISNWFANVRKRGKVPISRVPQPPADEVVELPTQIPSANSYEPLFHRWLNSWTDQEASVLPAILEAVSQLKGAPSGEFLRGSTRFHRQFCPSESSLSSMEVRSYAASITSVWSEERKTIDNQSTVSTQPKRRHRRPPVQLDSCPCSGVDQLLVSRRFQCTFCPDRFRTKYDWQRHEKSIHLPLEKWMCSPHGSVDVNSATNEVTCAFCGIVEPSPEHILGHRYAACALRSVAERTFYRKDHLRQHLRLMHVNCPLIPSMESWKSVNVIRSRCGFCHVVLDTWEDRVEHLAEHFLDGVSVAEDWDGDWGFSEEISNMLEKASLPEHSKQENTSEDIAPSSLLDGVNDVQLLDFESSLFDTETTTDFPCDFENFDPSLIWDDSMVSESNFSSFEAASSHAIHGVKLNPLPTPGCRDDWTRPPAFPPAFSQSQTSTPAANPPWDDYKYWEFGGANAETSSFQGDQLCIAKETPIARPPVKSQTLTIAHESAVVALSLLALRSILAAPLGVAPLPEPNQSQHVA
ncbi:hypothetical protein VTL71DRAFT_45 [Oculimacula yallundae]|uniref:Uncharacterized protein n=1 Tax=Oculimacula yallundae TaxID=86028 RepID=A0ABR4CZ21_9HELO